MAKKILVVDDEPDVRRGLRTVLEAEGFLVLEAEDGPSGLEMGLSDKPDALILDLMIPRLDGYGVCRELRARGSTLPVLILSARSGELDKVLGFELGADDYLTKPFSIRELVARLRALIRRAAPPDEEVPELAFGEVLVDLRRYKACRGGRGVDLFHFEVELLKLLAGREGQPVSRAEILEKVWGEDSYPTTRTVDFHICNLRKKLEDDPARPRHLLTVHGVGYRFVK